MNDCKYCKIEVANGIEHEICLNDEMKKIQKTEENIPCITKNCGHFEKKYCEQGEERL